MHIWLRQLCVFIALQKVRENDENSSEIKDNLLHVLVAVGSAVVVLENKVSQQNVAI